MLLKTALLYQHKKEAFSRKEILKRINEIKYLSSQKNVPKLTLRKEIQHLEAKLGAIFEVEKSIQKQKKKESTQVRSLKAKVKSLQKQLEISGDVEIKKKIEKLSHLLGTCLAKNHSGKEIKTAKKLLKEIKAGKRTPLRKVAPPVKEVSVVGLQQRITLLKQELAIKKQMDDVDEDVVKNIEDKIALIEKSLGGGVKHTIKFGVLPKAEKVELEKELPLPPPPKIV